MKERNAEESKGAYGRTDEMVGAFEAKTHLSRLLREVAAGKRFVITQRGKPVAELVPPHQKKTGPVRGDMKGKIRVADDFCEPVGELEKYFSP